MANRYNEPEPGMQNWHEPLNENFENLSVDVEMRDAGEPDAADATAGAKYLDTETGKVYIATDEEWVLTAIQPRVDEDSGAFKIDGDIEATGTKHFVQSVQTAQGPREVVYTATEDPTPRTECSGVAQLEDGRAEISLPEHFAWVTNGEEPLLVQTTPYAVDSDGLAVVERSVSRLVVEDRSGTGEYEFSYTVKGTREGHENRQVVRVPASKPPARNLTTSDD